MPRGSIQGNTQASPPSIYGITPVYNEEATVGEVLHSIVLWRNYGRYGKGLEKWLIVDDGSSDCSRSIIEGYCSKHPFLKLIPLEQNKGKGYAYKVAGEWLRENSNGLANKLVFQLDSDIQGLNPSDFDRLIEALIERVRIGAYTGPRISSLGLVPSPKYGLRRKLREFFSGITARRRIAITGQRVYSGSIMLSVLPQLDETTGFGLETLIDAEVKRRLISIKETYGLSDRQARQLIAVSHWRGVFHKPYMQKLKDSDAGGLRHPIIFLKGCGHYIRIGTESAAGFLKGALHIKGRGRKKGRADL